MLHLANRIIYIHQPASQPARRTSAAWPCIVGRAAVGWSECGANSDSMCMPVLCEYAARYVYVCMLSCMDVCGGCDGGGGGQGLTKQAGQNHRIAEANRRGPREAARHRKQQRKTDVETFWNPRIAKDQPAIETYIQTFAGLRYNHFGRRRLGAVTVVFPILRRPTRNKGGSSKTAS